ncbi:helix-turn-helix transcriptional regulator [Natrarchaeobius chitinivorans]|nr:hypothetical protein [Natrarchaeobius chitinivorans]
MSGSASIVGATDDRTRDAVQTSEPASISSSTPEDVDADQVRMDVELLENGSAQWTVEFFVRLEDEESIEAFESIRDDIDEDPEPYLTRFADRIDTTVAAAGDATDREMAIDGFAVETDRQTVGRDFGIVRYTFDWHGFAAVDESVLQAGDAIEGLYLEEGSRLLIAWPEDYELASASPEPDERRDHATIWYGSQTDFISGEPEIVLSSGSTGQSLRTLAIGIVVFGASALGGGLWYRRKRNASEDGKAGDHRELSTGKSTAGETVDDDRTLPEEFLSNEERVLRLLETKGGRIKQQDVVSELEWTDAKTSKVVSGLREDGKLESFRLGRENVLTLPERNEDDHESED